MKEKGHTFYRYCELRAQFSISTIPRNCHVKLSEKQIRKAMYEYVTAAISGWQHEKKHKLMDGNENERFVTYFHC